MKNNVTIEQICKENKVKVYEETFEAIRRDPEMKKAMFRRLAKARV